MVHVICGVHGAQFVPQICPIGPTMARPPLPILGRVEWDDPLWGGDPDCDHYVYLAWSGVKCARCPGWYCE
jgi:hypothetical protein